ncbi:hypothetical protein DRN73_09690 [Candidatus Pacearchaeota archaeon]|nr:MAG: hypothetical protein DRN73_09690 [Candidatus Pacearchaeota archaeon]
MIIPTQLKNCRFCKIKKGEKAPFEKNWQNKLISYNLISEYFPKYNYGVLCGYDQLGVLDDDSPDEKLIKLFDENFKETFQVRKHYYIYLKGWNQKKIIFYDGEEHLGELQGKGTQVVGAGSLHPSGEFYELIKDLPILKIEFDDFKKVFGKYMKKEISKKEYIKNKKIENWEGEDINKINISNILYPDNAKVKGSQIQGSHPIHGSNTGSNFIIDTSNNKWYCFRCQSGGGIWTAIAISEGMIDCSQCRNYNFSEKEKKEIIKIAHDKYGLKYPKSIEEKRYEDLKLTCTKKVKNYLCPRCGEVLFFNGTFVNCKNCNYFKSFRKYYLENKK